MTHTVLPSLPLRNTTTLSAEEESTHTGAPARLRPHLCQSEEVLTLRLGQHSVKHNPLGSIHLVGIHRNNNTFKRQWTYQEASTDRHERALDKKPSHTNPQPG